MNTAWTEFLQASEPSDHGAHVYGDVGELAQSAGAYLATGFDRGEPAVVIATREHWSRFAERLATCGWGEAEIEGQGLLSFADAEEILAAVMVDGAPSAERFEQVVGGLMDQLEERFPGRRIRAYGELVDLLCQRGDAKSAAALEYLWNDYAKCRDFSLLCAYRLDLFDRATQVSVLPDICRAHSHVRPGEDPARLQRAVDSALDEALGADAGKVYVLTSELRRERTLVPAAQLALMWVSAQMPAHAERLLASARRNYLREPVGS
jgi:hypothetical protein